MDLPSPSKQHSSSCHPTDAHVESPAETASQVSPLSSHCHADDSMDVPSSPKQHSSTHHSTDTRVESPAAQVPPLSSRCHADARAESPAKMHSPVQFSELAVASSSANHPTPQTPTFLSLSLKEAFSTPADWHAEPDVDEDSDEAQMETDDLYDMSSKDVLAANAFQPVIFSASKAKTVEDLIYY